MTFFRLPSSCLRRERRMEPRKLEVIHFVDIIDKIDCQYDIVCLYEISKAMEAFSQQAHLISQNCDNYFRNSTYVTNRFLGRENLATSGYFHLLSTTTKLEVKTKFCLRMNFVGGFQNYYYINSFRFSLYI